MAHARVYNDYVVERFTPYFDRLAPDRARSRSPTSTTRSPRSSASPPAGSGRSSCRRRRRSPTTRATSTRCGPRPRPTACSVFFHTQTGGVKVNDPEAHDAQGRAWRTAAQVNQPMTEKSASKRMVTQAVYSTIVPQQLICELIGGGVPERYPDLHFSLIEFNAHWLASLVGAHGQVLGHRHRPGRRLVARQLGRHPPADDQPNMAQLFRLNEKWPYPLTPSEYVQRQFHVSVPGRPGRRRLPAHHRRVDDRVGQRLPARRGHVPRQPGAARRRSSPASPTTSARPWSAAPSAASSASRPRWPA